MTLADIMPSPHPLPPISRRLRLIIAAIALAALVIAALTWLLRPMPPPASITSQIDTFTPYFYRHGIPAGYSIDRQHISYEQGILMIPLSKPGSARIVLTEQHLSSQLTEDQLLQNGERITYAPHPAAINDVEDRRVAVMVISSRQTLVLINGPASVPKDNLAALIRALQPL